MKAEFAKDDVDFGLLTEYFCRTQAEVDAEEAKKKAKETTVVQFKTVLEGKKLTDLAFAIASLGISASDALEALLTLDEYSLNEE